MKKNRDSHRALNAFRGFPGFLLKGLPSLPLASAFCKYILGLFVMVLTLSPAYSHAGSVKIFLDESRTKYIMANKMDCKVYKSKKGITLGFKVGNFLIGAGPEITFGGEYPTNWNKSVQQIISRYQELCSRFNTGTITKKEYDERLAEIDGISEKAMELQRKIKDRVKQDAADAFNELSREIDKQEGTSVAPSSEMEGITEKLDNLAPLSSPSAENDVLLLITDEDISRQKEAMGRTLNASKEKSKSVKETSDGPIIKVLSPEGEKVGQPAQFEIVFEKADNGADINMKSLKVVYEGFIRIDLTSRIKPYIQENKIYAPKVKLPSGKYKISIYIEDSEKKASVKPIQLRVSKNF